MLSRKLIAVLLLLLVPVLGWAGTSRVEGVRMWPAPDNTRVVFDLSGPVEHTLFTLKNPDRIVIDIQNAQLATPLNKLDLSGTLIERVRAAARDGNDLRVVFDMKKRVRPKSFLLQPNAEYGHRLVLDLVDATSKPKVVTAPKIPSDRPRDVVIAIDAGHGGEDPGAIGPHGTREKNVTLAIARRLKRLIAAQPGMRPFMIRDGDYFVSLRDRVKKARENQADLFVSIHADAFRDRRAYGSSVYTLSRRGATSEHAKWLAAKENSSDLIGGVSLDDKDDLLASVLLDLSQTAAIEASRNVASQVLSQLHRVGRVHRSRIERAGFRVLKAPDVPSILVETAFITNPHEERQLRNAHHQEQLAEAIMKGVRAYFRQNPPPGTILARGRAGQHHRIARGETLSGIARQYHVSLDILRDANRLKTDRLQAGDVIDIPRADDS